VIIFVLLVFVLAQGFLSVTLSSRDQALDRLNRQVAELADMLALERGQGEELRRVLLASETRARDAAAARDALAAQLGTARTDLARAYGERDAAQSAAQRLTARLADAELLARGADQRLTGLDAQLADALTRAEAATGDVAQTLRRLNDANRGLGAAERQSREDATALARLNQVLAESQAVQEREVRASAERASRGATETARLELGALRRQLAEAGAAQAGLERQIAALRAERDALDQTVRADRATIEARLADLARLTAQRDAAQGEQSRLSDTARNQVALLTRQIEELRAQLSRLASALDAAGPERDAQVTNLRAQLNAALAARVEELQRYRSDFFGRLREVLGDRPELRIAGDRFIVQSEVLFPPASAELSANGDRQLRQLARLLIDITRRIPPEIAWVLRVDGHADRAPIRTARFASNWELSAARAIAVATLLVAEGLPANRVAAAAFGENQPLDQGDTPEAYARNRRIELRLTDR
jgi:chemotaxis protein MotB